MDLFWFAFWIGLCGLVGWFANSKGRSGILAFFASMILSPIVVVVIVALVRRKNVPVNNWKD